MNTPAIPVVCAIIENPPLFLAAKRGHSMDRAGLWEFPGGKVKSNENPIQALKREIGEEFGIGIDVGKLLSVNIHQYPDCTIALSAYTCMITAGKIKPVEHDEVSWVTKEEALELQWAPADVPIMKKYCFKI
jgi:8-oxo-dGTP diphosphatase